MSKLHPKPAVAYLRQEWLAYLREPDRKQARHKLQALFQPEARCCLGHACALFAEPQTIGYEGDQRVVQYGLDKQSGILPASLAKRLDVTQRVFFRETRRVPVMYDLGQRVHEPIDNAVDLNDGTPLSLAEIADILEEQMLTDNLHPWTDNDQAVMEQWHVAE